MANTQSLLEQRRQQAQVYKELGFKVHFHGIAGLTKEETIHIEELHQLFLNGEFSSRMGTETLEFLTQHRIARTSKRVAEGKEPYDNTFFDRWRWDLLNRVYRWQDTEEQEPSDFTTEGLLWQPKELKPSSSHPEQEKTL